MKIEPLNFLFNNNFKLNKNLYFISGNETSLMEKIKKTLIDRYSAKSKISLFNIDNISNFVEEVGLFEDKKIYIVKNCYGIDEENLKKIYNSKNIFIFVQENSAKIKNLKKFLLKDADSYLIDCYELNRDSKIKILNDFLNINKVKIDKGAYWMLVEKLDSKYFLAESSLNKMLELDHKDLTLVNIKKILTVDGSGKERLFFCLLKKNTEIIIAYREKIETPADVNEFYYYCKSFCQMIIDCKNEQDYSKKIPLYLFKEKNYLVSIFRKYSSKKKKLLLRLLSSTEKRLRKESRLSLAYGLRFLLNIKKITIS